MANDPQLLTPTQQLDAIDIVEAAVAAHMHRPAMRGDLVRLRALVMKALEQDRALDRALYNELTTQPQPTRFGTYTLTPPGAAAYPETIARLGAMVRAAVEATGATINPGPQAAVATESSDD